VRPHNLDALGFDRRLCICQTDMPGLVQTVVAEFEALESIIGRLAGSDETECHASISPLRVCKSLQAVPKQASTIGRDRPSGGTADPDFPGSAAFCYRWRRPVTPEAAGSSPVDPATK
jgi:hypothetical protein